MGKLTQAFFHFFEKPRFFRIGLGIDEFDLTAVGDVFGLQIRVVGLGPQHFGATIFARVLSNM
jgi:hypothetical protein